MYFDNLDDIIIQSTEYCMSKVEDEFMAKAPPMWRTYGGLLTRSPTGRQKTRQEIQTYVSGLHSPEIQRVWQEILCGCRWTIYRIRKEFRAKAGDPSRKITPLIFILIRACVHYALFEDEFYMKSQIESLKETLELFITKYNPKSRTGSITK